LKIIKFSGEIISRKYTELSIRANIYLSIANIDNYGVKVLVAR